MQKRLGKRVFPQGLFTDFPTYFSRKKQALKSLIISI